MLMKKSKWFFWSFLPFVNFAAWIHAGIRTGRNSYYFLAAVYSLPFTVAVTVGAVQENLGLSKQAVDHVNDFVGTAGVLLWIAGMIHALLKKDSVDQQIQAYDDGRMHVVRAVANSPSQLSNPILPAAVDASQPRIQTVASAPPAWQPPVEPATATAKAAIKGAILDYSIQTGEGIISGDDNNRYKFAGSEWKASEAPARGQRVDFNVVGGRAIEVFQEQSSVLKQRIQKPQAFTPFSTSNNSVKGKTNQHAGKRGVLGVVVIIFGLWMMIGAKKDAGDVAKTYFQSGQQGGFVGLAADNALAKTAGYDSMEDYMAEQNRSSGLFCICVGVGLTVWGYKKYYNSPVQTK